MDYVDRNIKSELDNNSFFRSPEFQELLKRVDGHTVMGSNKLIFVYEISLNYKDEPMAEVGVYKGGSAYIIANNCEKEVYLIDTFTGLPKVSEYDKHKEGDFRNVDYIEVCNYLEPFKNVKILEGLFNERKNDIPETEFGFVHLDVDIYEATKECLEYFYPKIRNGGSILIDDYDSSATEGCKKAVDDFFENRKEHCITLGTTQGLIIINKEDEK